MLKGAITIFAFSIFLFSCAAQVTTQPPPAPPQSVLLPDLTISDISLGETGKVEVMISNIGKGPAPYRVGSLVIYVNGHLKWRDSLGTLPDQTFLQPGGFVLYTTPVELVGRHEVRAVVDNEDQMVEENGANNVFIKVLGKEILELKPLLPDLTITDLFLNPQRKLAVTIANMGDSPLPLGGGNLKIIVDGSLKGSYTLGSLSNQSFLPMKGSITLTTPLTLVGRHEIDAHVDFTSGVKESNEENNSLKKILDGAPFGPDIVVKDLDLTEDLELMIILSNAGEVGLRKDVTFRFRILVNHFISEALKANFGNRYLIDPPYGVGIAGISKVKVSISPKLPSDDIRLENNVLERTFIIFPFKVGPQGREEFSFSFSAPRPQGDGQTEKVKAEARWEGGSSSLMLSFKKSGTIKGIPTLSGKSPLKVEFPISFEEVQKESVWNVLITNLIDKKVEGHLIIQHP
jgi:archaellum component FlaG (FlaF/FlaG flagellin family)